MGFDQLLRYMNERHCQGTDQGGFMKLDLKIDRAQFEELRAEHGFTRRDGVGGDPSSKSRVYTFS